MTGQAQEERRRLAVERWGTTAEQWRRVKAQVSAAGRVGSGPPLPRTRKLVTWGDVEGLEALFSAKPEQGGVPSAESVRLTARPS